MKNHDSLVASADWRHSPLPNDLLSRKGVGIAGAICRFWRCSFDYLMRRETLKESTMDTIFLLIGAVITLAALNVGEAGARTRR